MILPVRKLGILAVRSLAKPIASRLKVGAGLHPTFRQFIINIAQANHRVSTIMQRRIYGHVTNIAVRPLVEEKAVEAAAAMLGELFIFTVAGAAIIYEVQKNSKAEAKKEEMRRQELEALRQSNRDLAREVEHLRHKMEEMSNRSIFNILPPSLNGRREYSSSNMPSHMKPSQGNSSDLTAKPSSKHAPS